MEPITPYEFWDSNEEILGKRIFRPLVYLFEHIVLPEAIFSRHPMAKEILDPTASPDLSLSHFISASAAQCEIRGLWPEDCTIEMNCIKYIISITQQIVSERSSAVGYDPLLYIEMPQPKAPGEARQVIITCGRNPRYFLEEVSNDAEMVFLCERDPYGSHLNFGPHRPMPKANFIAWAREQAGAAVA